MANSWNIIIEPQPDGTAAFRPNIPGAQPGQPLGADVGDNVTWDNRTQESHKLVATQPPNVFIANEIPSGEVSEPIFNVPGTVEYHCELHPNESGRIVVQSGTS